MGLGKKRFTNLSVLVLAALGWISCSGSTATPTHYLHGFPALVERGLIHVVVEIPAGTNAKWEVEKASGGLHWEQKDGKPRVVQFLAYPGNYGMIPRTSLPYEVGGDGDPLDVLLLGPQVARGSVVQARPIGVLQLLDDGERDDKILAVPLQGPLSDVTSLESLETLYPGVQLILETWFTSYKGSGRITSSGFAGTSDAVAIVREANAYYIDASGDP